MWESSTLAGRRKRKDQQIGSREKISRRWADKSPGRQVWGNITTEGRGAGGKRYTAPGHGKVSQKTAKW